MTVHRALLAGLLLLTLVACSTFGPQPQLHVSEKSFALDSSSDTARFSISNRGEPQSVLSWTIRSSSSHVTTTPSKGEITGSGSAEVEVEVDQSGLSKGDTLSVTLVVGSNGGSAEVAIYFEMKSEGLDRCGTFPLIEPDVAGVDSQPGDAYVPGQLLVRYREPVGAQAEGRLETLRRISTEVGENLSLLKPGGRDAPDLVKVSAEADLERLAAELERDPRVLYAEPNYYLEALETLPNDRYLDDQWNLLDFGLPQAWDLETGENRVVIAVIDSGVDMDHEDLRDKFLPGCDFHDGDNNPNPGPHPAPGHGTHVAGIAAAIGDNERGVAGVAYGPGVKILPIKVFDDAGIRATTAELVDAIRWAAGLEVRGVPKNPNKADVINMSLGTGKKPIKSIDEAAKQAWDAGVVLVAAAGNAASTDGIMSPANAPEVIAVGSVNSDYRRSDFSDYALAGRSVDLMAPGGFTLAGNDCANNAVRSTFPDDGYSCSAGTSMASAFVAGAAALLLSHEPTLSPQEVKERLTGSALFEPSFMTAGEYGAGVVCADRALGAPTRCGR